jgi:nucleotide-binding universal stress UspA family protein
LRQAWRILAGVDFSVGSRNAAEWAARQLGPDIELVLMHAIDLPVPPRAVGGSDEHRIQERETARRGAQVRLRELRTRLGTKRVRTRIRVGQAAAQLAAAARAMKADVIVVGEPSVRSGLQRALGTTVQGLIRRSTVPVLQTRCPPEHPIERIVVAVDETASGKRVSSQAQRLATHFGSQVTVLHIVEAGLLGAVGIAAGAVEEKRAVDALVAAGVARADTHLPVFASVGVRAESLCVPGEPAVKILDVAQHLDADLIVLGIRQVGRLERALCGVIAQDVLRGATCSVLVVTAADK